MIFATLIVFQVQNCSVQTGDCLAAADYLALSHCLVLCVVQREPSALLNPGSLKGNLCVSQTVLKVQQLA